jgi:NTE family protein
MKNKAEKKYKLGVVLSGGGTRGFAHVGFLKALNEEGIYPDIVSGASAGSIAGALYADGYTPDEMARFFKESKLRKYIEFVKPNGGMVKLSGLMKMLINGLKAKTFEELKIPLYIAVCNLNKGEVEYISQGSLAKFIIASSTIPGLFQPALIGDNQYVDGGTMDNLPILPLEGQCECIIGQYVNPIIPMDKIGSVIQIIDRTMHMMMVPDVRNKRSRFDMLVEPAELSKYGLLSVKDRDKIIEIGYKATKKALKSWERKVDFVK